MLIVYPILVALLVALALQRDERRPDVAVVNLDTSGRTVAVGDRRLGIEDYVARLARGRRPCTASTPARRRRPSTRAG